MRVKYMKIFLWVIIFLLMVAGIVFLASNAGQEVQEFSGKFIFNK